MPKSPCWLVLLTPQNRLRSPVVPFQTWQCCRPGPPKDLQRRPAWQWLRWVGIQWRLATGDYHRKMEVLMGKPEEHHRKMEVYPLVNIQKLWKISIFNG